MTISNAVSQDAGAPANRIVVPVPAPGGWARRENPSAVNNAGGVGLLEMVGLMDTTGNAISSENPLPVSATLNVGNVSVTIGAVSLAPGSNTIGNLGPGTSHIGNVGIDGGTFGGNPAAGPVGAPAPDEAGLTGFANSSGYMTSVSGTTPLPTLADGIATAVELSPSDMTITPLNLNLSGELRTTANVTSLPPISLANSANNIGNVAITGTVPVNVQGGSVGLLGGTQSIGSVTQANSAAFNATVANAPNFQVFLGAPVEIANGVITVENDGTFAVQVTNTVQVNGTVSVSSLPPVSVTGTVEVANAAGFEVFIAGGEVSLIGNATVNGTVSVAGQHYDANGALFVNAGVIASSGGNPAAGPVGSAPPSDASYTGFLANGVLTPVSDATPLPVMLQNATLTVSNVVVLQDNAALLQATVANAANFQVEITNGNVGLIGNATIDGSVSILGPVEVSNAANFQVEVLGAVTTATPSYTNGQNAPLSLDLSGNVRTKSASDATVGGPDAPQTATLLGYYDPTTSFLLGVGSASIPGVVGPLPVDILNIVNTTVSGTVTVSNATGFQVELVGNASVEGTVSVDSLPPVDIATMPATAADLAATPGVGVWIGYNQSGSFQGVGTSQPLPVLPPPDPAVGTPSLGTALGAPTQAIQLGFSPDGLNFAAVSNAAPLPVELYGNSTVTGNVGIIGTVSVSNAPGFQVSVTNTGFVSSQSNAQALQATVANAANFQVEVISAPPVTGSVSLTGNATVNGSVSVIGQHFDANGALFVNAGVIASSGGNPAAGPTGSAVPASASYTGFQDGSGNLEGVSASSPLPSSLRSERLEGDGASGYVSMVGFQSSIGEATTISAGAPLPVETIGNSIVEGSVSVLGAVEVANAPGFQAQVTGSVSIVGNSTVNGTVAVSTLPPVSNAANFQVFVENFPASFGSNVVTLAAGSNTIGNVGLVGNATVQGTVTVANAPSFEVSVTNFPASTTGAVTIGPGSNAIGSITNTGFVSSQSNAAALQATVSNSANFQVTVNSAPPVTGNVGVIGTITVANAANFHVTVDNPSSLGAVSLSNSANSIGSINNTSFAVTQATASALNATVANAPGFQVGIVGNTTVQGSVSIIGGGGSNPAAGTIGAAVPASGSYTAYANSTGILTAVTAATPLPVSIANANISVTATNPAAGPTGNTVPTNASYTGFNLGGALVGVSNAAPLPVTNYSVTSQIQVNPAITASSAYTAGNVVGGLLTFANVTRGVSGVLQSATITCKSIQTSGFDLYIFTTNPSNSTWTDKSAPAINAADVQSVKDVIHFPAYISGLGTMTLYASDNVGRAFNANSTTLYGVLVCSSTPTFASTSDIFVTLTVLED